MGGVFTNFCCRSGGDNLNAGTVTGGTTEPAAEPLVTYTGGNYTGSSGIYVAPVGADMTAATVGRFMSVYADGDTNPTTAQYVVGRITAVNAGTRTITMATRLNFGTAMGTTTGNRSARIGGAWKGPNGAIPFPYGFINTTLTDATVNRPRINLKSDQTYALTTPGISTATAGPFKTQGYTTTFADGGRATFDGGTAGASFVLFTNGGTLGCSFEDVAFQNNGATGTASLFEHTTSGNSWGIFRRCVFAHSRGHGLLLAQGPQNFAEECEAYDCNQSNTAALGGFAALVTGAKLVRCISHHHSGANTVGFAVSSNAALINCIAAANAGYGVRSISAGVTLFGCDLYANSVAGFVTVVAGGNEANYFENCNFFKNGRGVDLVAAATSLNYLVNCTFGNGTMANTLGDVNFTLGTDIFEDFDTAEYPADQHPWADPDNGDFRLRNPLAKGAGRGLFLQTDTVNWSAPNTVAYPDIGAAQHQDITVQPTYGIGV